MLKKSFNRKILLLFGLAIILGFMLGLREEKQTIDITIINSIKEWEIFKVILLNNTIAFLLLCCGALIVGKVVIYMFFGINGYLIGAVLGRGREFITLILLIPHGILEMGSFLFTGTVLYHLLSENEKGNIISNKKKYYNLFLLSYFILAISVLIEAFITPHLVFWLSNF